MGGRRPLFFLGGRPCGSPSPEQTCLLAWEIVRVVFGIILVGYLQYTRGICVAVLKIRAIAKQEEKNNNGNVMNLAQAVRWLKIKLLVFSCQRVSRAKFFKDPFCAHKNAGVAIFEPEFCKKLSRCRPRI